MVNIPERLAGSLDKNTLGTLNARYTPPISRDTVFTLNRDSRGTIHGQGGHEAPHPSPARQSTPVPHPVPSPARQSTPVPHPAPSPARQSTPVPHPAPSPARQSAPVPHPAPSPVRQSAPPPTPHPSPAPPARPVPPLIHPLQKGQKTSIEGPGRSAGLIRACFGWNTSDARCDMDASAFLLGQDGRVLSDDWFVFYGQRQSPDGSVIFQENGAGSDREVITADLGRLSPAVQRIVFVLTINEALERRLNFGMMRDVYIRLLAGNTQEEIVSFALGEYYENVTSMTIGELYRHNGQWKFNPVGNGVNKDLAGQCAIYGVQISG